jgi:hypothetical protein
MIGAKLDELADLRPEEAGGGPLAGKKDGIVPPSAELPLARDEIGRVISELHRPGRRPSEVDMVSHQEEVDSKAWHHFPEQAAKLAQRLDALHLRREIANAREGGLGLFGTHSRKLILRRRS